MAHGDLPITTPHQDHLDRAPVVRALGALLADPDLDTPLAVGVYGAWGSGKTSVLRLLEHALDGDNGALMLRFDAWRYAHHEEALWRAFLQATIEALGAPGRVDKLVRLRLGPKASKADREDAAQALNKRLDQLGERLYRSLSWKEKGDRTINWVNALPTLARIGATLVPGVAAAELTLGAVLGAMGDTRAGAAAAKVIEREERTRYADQVGSLEQFRTEFAALCDAWLLRDAQGAALARPRRLFIFVDDLDRCLPESAIRVLEAMKAFLDVPGVVFVLGMDRQVVEQGIRIRYERFAVTGKALPVDAGMYLDKIVQVPVQLPPLGQDQIEGYIQGWCAAHKETEMAAECAAIVAAGADPNPRMVKRALNVTALLRKLRTSVARAGHRPPPEELRRLAVLAVLQTCARAVYDNVVADPNELRALEAKANRNTLDGPHAPRLRRLFAALAQGRPGAAIGELNQGQLTELVQLTRFSAG